MVLKISLSSLILAKNSTMKISGLLTFIFFLTLFIPVKSSANAFKERNNLIDQSLECISSNLDKNNTLAWTDICYQPTENRKKSLSKEEIIDVELDYFSDAESEKDTLYVSETDEIYIDNTFAYANINELKTEETSGVKNSLSTAEFGTEISKITYREPEFMRTRGYMSGVFGSYTQRFSLNKEIHSFSDLLVNENVINMIKIDGKFSWGYVDYESEGTGKAEDERDFLLETRLVAGQDLPFKSSLLTPYAGVGYRYLNNDGRGETTTGHNGYRRESMYVYIPMGLDIKQKISKNWSMGINMEYDFFMFGRQISHLEDVDSNYDPLSNKQEKGFGWRGSIRLAKESPKLDIFVEPFIRYWSIKDSKTSEIIYGNWIVGTGMEPENNSTEFGFKMGAAF